MTTTSSPLADGVYQKVLDLFTSLELLPGERMAVDVLARRYGVSQTPVRQALTRLEGEGLVEKHHLRGYRASPQMTFRELESLFAVRIMLECASARWAADRATAQDVAGMRRYFDFMQSCAGAGDYGQFAVSDARFHDAIAQGSGNLTLHRSLSKLHVHLHVFRVRSDAQVADTGVEEHLRILKAIESKCPDTAEKSMREHIERSWERIAYESLHEETRE